MKIGLYCISVLCKKKNRVIFIYVYWFPTQFPYKMMFVSFNSNTMGVTCGAGIANLSGAPDFTPGF